MGLFTKSPIGEIVGIVGETIDDLHYSGQEKADMKMKFAQLLAKSNLAQMDVNKQEAKNGRLFVSGWRPFVGWTCGLALAWTFVASPIVQSIAFYVATFAGRDIDLTGLPQFDLSLMMPVLLGMLGLGGLRTYEKVNGVSRSTIQEQPAYVRGAVKAMNAAKAAFASDTKRLKKGPSRGS